MSNARGEHLMDRFDELVGRPSVDAAMEGPQLSQALSERLEWSSGNALPRVVMLVPLWSRVAPSAAVTHVRSRNRACAELHAHVAGVTDPPVTCAALQ